MTLLVLQKLPNALGIAFDKVLDISDGHVFSMIGHYEANILLGEQLSKRHFEGGILESRSKTEVSTDIYDLIDDIKSLF